MHVLFAILAVAAAEPAAQAVAPSAPAAQAERTDEKTPAKTEKVCVTRTETGSRFKQKNCFGKAEYERRQLEERRALERMQRVPLTGN